MKKVVFVKRPPLDLMLTTLVVCTHVHTTDIHSCLQKYSGGFRFFVFFVAVHTHISLFDCLLIHFSSMLALKHQTDEPDRLLPLFLLNKCLTLCKYIRNYNL